MFLEHRSDKSPWAHPIWGSCRERCASVVAPYRFRWAGDSSGVYSELSETWDRLTAHGPLKLQRAYLDALSQLPVVGRRVHWQRAIIFYDDQDTPVGAAILSVTDFDAPSVAEIIAKKSMRGSALLRVLRIGVQPMSGAILTCGGSSESGGAGFYFTRRADRARATKGLLRALRESAHALKVNRPISATLVQGSLSSHELNRAGYTQFNSEPDMTLMLSNDWETYDHYLDDLTSKYRVKAHRADAKSSALKARELTSAEVEYNRDTLLSLHDQVTSRARFSIAYPEVKALPALMKRLPGHVRVFGYWLGEELIGFRISLYSSNRFGEASTLPHNTLYDIRHDIPRDTLYAYAVGLNYDHAREHSLYPRMLNDYIREALSRGMRQVCFGRTASEIKSTLGAVARPTEIYLRYQQPLVNLTLPLISHRVQLPEFRAHTPFKRLGIRRTHLESYGDHMLALLEGYLIGLALIILIGPVLFVLLHATLERGRTSGAAVATGIMISDVIIIALCMLGGGDLEVSSYMGPYLAWGGGLILLGLGARYVVAPPVNIASQPKVNARGLAAFFVKGFAVNFVNPFVFLVWMGIISGVKLRHQGELEQWLFMAGNVAGIYTLDLAKVYLAHRIKPLFKPLILRRVLRAAGVLLIAFSLRLFYTGLTL